MKITFDQVQSFLPCSKYKDRDYVLSLTGGRDEIEVSEIAALTIPERHKMWLLIKILGTTKNSKKHKLMLACDCAERALQREKEAGRKTDARSWTAVEVTREYAMGWAAACADDASGLLRAVTGPYVCCGGCGVDVDAYAAAYADEQKWQINKLLEYIVVAATEEEKGDVC